MPQPTVIKSNTKIKILYFLALSVFGGFAAWWLYNYFFLEPDARSNELFSDTHGLLALIGSLIGFWVATKWGGIKSVFGRSIFLLSLGLLAQVFGQAMYSYYALVQGIEAPYPSIGDIGYFGSVILYIFAILLLAKTAGAKFNNVSTGKKLVATFLPLALLAGSYLIFLKDYEFDWTYPLVVLLDFGYPLGQATYLALAILTFLLSRGLLGGIMKNKILLLLGAFLVQYAADYAFLYRFNREIWYPGDISELLYLTAYGLMVIAILKFGTVAESMNRGQDNES